MRFSISVVVCTHNGASRIESCLSALVAQENSPAYEILVVDNASTDGTGDKVNHFLTKSFHSECWRVIQEERPGLLSARIAGMRAARYDWVLFCDDDNILFPNFLHQCHQILSKNSGIGVLGSHGIPKFLGPKPDWFDQYSSSYAVGPQQVETLNGKRLVHVYGAGSVYLKNPLLGLFDKGFKPVLSGRRGKEMSAGDDVEWCWLMQLLGYKIVYCSSLSFYHVLPASRLTWDYYIQLKSGISSSVGLLSPYKFYFSARYKSGFNFFCTFFFSFLISTLIFLKNIIYWNGKPKAPQDKLSLEILRQRMKSFYKNRYKAKSHFVQLKKFFGS